MAATPTPDQLLRAFEATGDITRRALGSPLVQRAGAAAGRYVSEIAGPQAAEAYAAARQAGARTATTLLEKGKDALQIARQLKADQLAKSAIERILPEAAKVGAAAEGAAETGVAAAAAEKLGMMARLRLLNNPTWLPGGAANRAAGNMRLLPRILKTGAIPLAAAAAAGVGMNYGGNRTLESAQGDAVDMLSELGMQVERPQLTWKDIPKWYSTAKLMREGVTDALFQDASNDEIIPASDPNRLRVFDAEGQEVGSRSIWEEIDLLKKQGAHQKLMDRMARLQNRANQ